MRCAPPRRDAWRGGAAESARRETEERERQWGVLMDQGRERFAIVHRVEHLQAELDAWYEADRIRRYCDAADAVYGAEPDAAAWLTWARQYADGLDPLREPPRVPASSEPTLAALQEHLPEGWRAEGPEPVG